MANSSGGALSTSAGGNRWTVAACPACASSPKQQHVSKATLWRASRRSATAISASWSCGPVTTFGAAFVFPGDRTDVLRSEDGQPARWWPLSEPPQRRREQLWDRMVEHLALDGPLDGPLADSR